MKIISLAPSNTDILIDLKATEQLAGTTSLNSRPEAREKPSLGGWTTDIDLGKIEEIDPDLVLTSDRLQEEVTEKLEEKGIDTLHVKPETLEETYKSIKKIGRTVKKEQRAEDIIEDMRKELEKIDLKNKRIYCEEWSNPPMASGNWIPGLIEAINGEYFLEEGERSREFDLKQLKQFNPEYIFLNICGAGENVSKETVLERAEWQDIKAVRNGNVYVIDDSFLNRPSPRLVKGAKKIEEKVNG